MLSSCRRQGSMAMGRGCISQGWSPLRRSDPVRALHPQWDADQLCREDPVEDVASAALPGKSWEVTDGDPVSPLQGEKMTAAVR